MEYSGTLHTPKDRDTILYSMTNHSQRFELEIDGEKLLVSIEPQALQTIVTKPKAE